MYRRRNHAVPPDSHPHTRAYGDAYRHEHANTGPHSHTYGDTEPVAYGYTSAADCNADSGTLLYLQPKRSLH